MTAVNLESPIVQAAFALVPAIILVATALNRNKRLDRKDAGGFFVALFAGFTVVKGLFLCSYFFSPDAPQIATKLHGYEKEIFGAGLIIIFLACCSVWSVCEDAAKPRS